MSRADAKTKLETKIANNTTLKNYFSDVSGTYSVLNPSTYAKEDWTGAGVSAWLTEWRTAHPSVVLDEEFTFPAEDAEKTSDQLDQIYAYQERDLATQKASVVADCNTRIAAYQTDLDDLIAGEEAGHVDQVSE